MWFRGWSFCIEMPESAASIAARLLEGAKPSAIPIEFPTHYELVVNARAAEDYGIKLPREFLARADRVIR